MRAESRSVYRFGPFHLDVAEQQLLRDGSPLPLTPKVFDVLRVLVQNSGHLVEKERFLAEVWPGSFVEEGALSRSISILRRTLGENGSEQKYIETVPKRGYRFVARVTERDSSTEPVESAGPTIRPSHTEPASIQEASAARAGWTRVSGWAAGVVGVLLIIGALAGLRRGNGGTSIRESDDSATGGSTAPAPVHRQVTFTGKERSPIISPDGKRIAYVSYEKPEKKLVVQELAGGPPLTIFTAPEIGHLRWSPDGSELLVWMRGPGGNGVYVLPQMGGTPRKIADGQFIACWSPDGSTIAVASYLKGIVWYYDTSGQLQRTVKLRDVDSSIWDVDWSAGGVLTFVSSDFQGRYTLWTVKPDGSEQQRVLDADSEIPSVRWAPTGDAIYYLRRVNQTFSVFKIRVAMSTETHDALPTTLVAGLESDGIFALSGERRLVYTRAPYYSNLWLVDADNGHDEDVETRELTSGTSLVERPSISPNGTSIVFNSGHEPATNLYTMPIAGGAAKQLTFRGSLNLEAVWSADGSQIAFASTEGGRPRVWVVGAGGGEPRALSSTDMSDTFDLTWSPGSRILYQQSGHRNYYELEPDTRAERLLVADSSVGWIFSPAYSPDGRNIAVMRNRPRDPPPNRGIYVIDPTDRRERLVWATSEASTMPIGWSRDGRHIYVLAGKNLNSRGLTAPIETVTEARILRVPLNGGNVETVTALPFEEVGGVTVTPDGRRIVCVVYSSHSDVWVVDNFDASR